MTTRAKLLLFLGLFCTANLALAQSTILGVLEDVPSEFSQGSHRFALRVLFQKSASEWRAYPSECPDQNCLAAISSNYPVELSWTVTFDGRTLGSVKSRTPKAVDSYSLVALQDLPEGDKAPRIGKRSLEFAGWPDEPVYRPLVATTRRFGGDPDFWKPASLGADDLRRVRAAFRRKYPKPCRVDEHDNFEALLYADRDLVVQKAYASKFGWKLAQLHLESAIDCNDTEAGFEIDDPWFVIYRSGSPRYLDSGMHLVDAGDYDDDGKSELVFSIDRYNRGGYVLYFDNFRRHVDFIFSYH
jgi:hypothetical protein